MKIVSKALEIMSYFSAVIVIAQILHGRRSVDIVQGTKGPINYDVKFEDGMLKINVGDKALGFANSSTVDGKIVVDALVDLIEGMIPGDQKAWAQTVKEMAHKALDNQVQPQAVAKA